MIVTALLTALVTVLPPPPDSVPLRFHRAHLPLSLEATTIPLGTAMDPPGDEGAVWLTMALLEEELARSLTGLPARVELRVEPDHTLVLLTAAPQAFGPARRAVTSALRAPVPSPERLERHRLRLRDQVGFQAGSPVEGFRREADRFLLGSADPAARPPRGTIESVDRLGPGVVGSLWLRLQDTPPIPPILLLPEAERSLWEAEADGRRSVGVEARALPDGPPPPPAEPVGALPWAGGDRLRITREVTNGWVSVAYPLPGGTPSARARAMAGILRERLDPIPSDPDLFALEVGVRPVAGGQALVLVATVAPNGMARWEDRLVAQVQELGEAPIPDTFFRLYLRRYRSREVLAEDPWTWLQRASGDLLRTGRLPDTENGMEGMDAALLHRLFEALGQPRILVYGPEMR